MRDRRNGMKCHSLLEASAPWELRDSREDLPCAFAVDAADEKSLCGVLIPVTWERFDGKRHMLKITN